MRKALWLAAFVAFPLLLRYFYSVNVHPGVMGDSVDYVNYAKNLFSSGYFGMGAIPDTVRPPLYPFLLGLTAKLFGSVPDAKWIYCGFNIACDAVSIACLAVIARRIGGGLSLMGVFFVSMSPIWFGIVNNALSEGISTTMYFLFLERWTRDPAKPKHDLWCAAYLSGATMARGMFLYFPVFVVLADWLVENGFALPGVKHLRKAGVFLLIAFTPSVLWGTRNYLVRDLVVHTEGDQAVYTAWLLTRHPKLDFRVPSEKSAFEADPLVKKFGAASTRSDKVAAVAQMKAEYVDYVREHPWDLLKLMVTKNYDLWIGGWWNPFHFAFSPDYLGAAFIWVFVLPILAFGSLGLGLSWRASRGSKKDALIRRRAISAQLALAGYVTAVCIPFLVDARYTMVPYIGFGLWFVHGLDALTSRLEKGAIIRPWR